MNASLVDRIDDLLPQTQCRRCLYAGCRPYAEAIARGEAKINQCPPGGAATIRALAELLGVEAVPLNPAYGAETPPQRVVIDEEDCIGCTKCIQACPVDAIVGAAKQMHTVIAADCTGCELCIPPCPVDCIAIVAVADSTNELSRVDAMEGARRRAHELRLRFAAHQRRFAEAASGGIDGSAADQTAGKAAVSAIGKDRAAMQAEIAAAIARVKAKRDRLRPAGVATRVDEH